MSVSAYEAQRNATIAENNEKLVALGLVKGEALLPVSNTNTAASKPKKRKAESVPAEPSRRSSRVRHEAAADVYVMGEDASSGKVVLGGTDAAKAAKEAEREAAQAAASHPDELPVSTDDLRKGLERTVWQRLREVRNAKAKAMERSMFIVCNDRTLCEMVRVVPTTLDELYDLFGMGEKKIKAHGQMLLDALAPHVDALHADHDAARREHAAIHGEPSGSEQQGKLVD